MLDTFLSIFGSAAGGGFLGLIGTAFKGWQEFKDRQAQREHEQKMRVLDQDEMRLENELAIKATEAEYNGKIDLKNIEQVISEDLNATELRRESYKHDQATYSKGALNKLSGFFGDLFLGLLVLVDVFRGIMRPGITTYLLIIESYIAWYLYQLVIKLDLMSSTQAVDLLTQVVMSIVFLTSTAITWWFGSRPNQQRRL